jgi:adenylate cyclase
MPAGIEKRSFRAGAVAAQTAAPLVPLGEHVLRGIAAPCAVFTLPDT